MEQKIFHHFPEIICVDTVSHTNKNKLPRLIISGRDSHEKNVYNSEGLFTKWKSLVFSKDFFNCNANIVSIIYLIKCENNYNWSLSPRIYADWYCWRKRFQNFITLRIRCGFHVVRMGWTHHIMKKHCFTASVGYFYDRACNHLKKWIYSWMKNSFKTREKYFVSKLIFKNLWTLNKSNQNLEHHSLKILKFLSQNISILMKHNSVFI